ncbi:MAG: helix-turn-helix transcriptional regulator [Clostridia bacterium]|nr:helix-turn-helix transcriptional regulator [Clostridia bacterium]
MALDYKIIGERIRNARVANNLTQENLAERLDVSVAFVSRIECGTTRVNLTRLSEICSILNIDEGLILNGVSTDSKNYLSDEFSALLKNCPKETQKLIYDVAKLIVNDSNKKM